LWVCVCVLEEPARTPLRATPFARQAELLGEQKQKRELQNLEPPKPKFKISKIKSKGCATRQKTTTEERN
jgi:hypothetical protein